MITNGFGAMYSYADRLEPADRWRIVAYIRVLQAARNAHLSDVPADERQKLLATQNGKGDTVSRPRSYLNRNELIG